MKKLSLILLLLPALLVAQQPSSFKVAKPRPPAGKADTVKPRRPFYFLLSTSDYREISSASDLYKVNLHPKVIKNRFDLDFSVPWFIPVGSGNIMLYAQTGIIICALTVSNANAFAIPLHGGILYSIGRIYLYADAGPQFFFNSAEPDFSGPVVSDWGGGIGYLAATLNSAILLGYQRLGNVNMEGVSITVLI